MSLELLSGSGPDGVRLFAPDVGLFTCALPRGAAVAPGQPAGRLRRLGRDVLLVVPAGVAGIVTGDPPERVLAPVGRGDALYAIAAFENAAAPPPETAEAEGEALVLRARGSGRFYHRPGPGEPPFVEPGATLEEGTVIGLIEVMKTFAHVAYHAEGGLPARARLVRLVAPDGADIVEGDPLIEVEPAPARAR